MEADIVSPIVDTRPAPIPHDDVQSSPDRSVKRPRRKPSNRVPAEDIVETEGDESASDSESSEDASGDSKSSDQASESAFEDSASGSDEDVHATAKALQEEVRAE